MKKLLFSALFLIILFEPSAFARILEIEVHGMTCSFCVDSLERKFKKMDSVLKVDVSLKLKKVRLETKKNTPSLEAIKKAVIDTGFTPIKIEVISR